MPTPLKNRVHFSGADIQVVAYRNIPSSQISNRLREIDTQLDQEKADLEFNFATRVQLDREVNAPLEIPSTLDPSYEVLDPLAQEDFSPLSSAQEGKAQNSPNTPASDIRYLQNEKDIETQHETIKKLQASRKRVDSGRFRYIEFSNIHTLSYSSFREKFAVRTLGRVHAKSYTRGPRTIAGTMIFNTVQKSELLSLVTGMEEGDTVTDPRIISADQIEPFDLMILFSNEYGARAAVHIFNVDISSEGKEMSIDTIITQNSFNFYATDIIPIQDLGNGFQSYTDMFNQAQVAVEEQGSIRGETIHKKNASSPNRVFNSDYLQRLEDGRLRDMLLRSRGIF